MPPKTYFGGCGNGYSESWLRAVRPVDGTGQKKGRLWRRTGTTRPSRQVPGGPDGRVPSVRPVTAVDGLAAYLRAFDSALRCIFPQFQARRKRTLVILSRCALDGISSNLEEEANPRFGSGQSTLSQTSGLCKEYGQDPAKMQPEGRSEVSSPVNPSTAGDGYQQSLGDHTLSVERLRYPARYRRAIPREARLCRLCRVEVEDEVHALLVCTASLELTELRERFLEDAFLRDDELEQSFDDMTRYEFLRRMVSSRKAIERIARFVFEALALFDRFQRILNYKEYYGKDSNNN
ncbi:hypothetical protein DFH06DRAFT_1144193 [Mycena polygramma]|nr:hypothetical protein DFH06DRAFT_1144193 [Mycena polygramma]